jgi:hypothetical protein
LFAAQEVCALFQPRQVAQALLNATHGASRGLLAVEARLSL